MQRRRFGLGGSSALNWSLGIAVAAACNVYDSSLLTGGSEGQGGTSSAGDGSGGDAGKGGGGTTGGSGADTGGGTSGKGGSSGTGTGGSNGGSAGDTGGTTNAGEGGEGPTGGTAGSGAGSAGKGGGAGSGGSGGDAGTGGACGKCGCGKAETGDTDMDGVLDCNDTCEDLNDADCDVLRSGLVHRYSFSGTGTTVTDTKGTAHGTAMGTGVALSGSGTLVLAGGSATSGTMQHVELPDGCLGGLTNATFEAWVTFDATGSAWQRVFDFGTMSTGSTGSYLFLTPRATSSSSGLPRAAFSSTGPPGELQTNGTALLPAGMYHFAVVVDDANDEMSLFIDGTRSSLVAFPMRTLSEISDVNCWLGRSQFTSDQYFAGTFDEFRIYNVALNQAQLRTSRAAGPNATLF